MRINDLTEPVLRLESVTKEIGKKIIVNELSLAVYPGEVFGLLGPNGAGKTTTIRMMVGLIAISSGEIWIHGHSVARDFQRAITHVGAIVENPEFYKFLSGHENLVHYANMYPRISRERLDEVASLVGLSERIDDPVQTYSLGMRQRLGVAQAVLHRPSVLILDEPTNGLDPTGIRELRTYLRTLAENEGVAVIVSSHLLAEMELMCDRTAFIKEGRLIDIKTIRNLGDEDLVYLKVDHPKTAGVAIQSKWAGGLIQCDAEGITITADRDRTAEAVAYLVNSGIKVYGVWQKVKTLEDIFMEVTADETFDPLDPK